jgi:hypothetical protein
MPRGKCALCDLEKDLKLSHFIPRAFYPSNVVFTNKNISGHFVSQMKQYLLCADCEDRFNKGGESAVLKWIAPNKTRFPLLERLKVALPVVGSVTKGVFSGPAIDIDTAKFAYFMLSILWRAAVADWVLPDGVTAERIDLGAYEDPIKMFLAGKGPFPPHVVVIVTVCDDPFSRGWFVRPKATKTPAGFRGYEFTAGGVYFHVLLGKLIPQAMRRMCCWSSSDKYIFRRSCADKTVPTYTNLAATARKVGKWAKES